MLLPERHWRKSSEAATSRMRFSLLQRLVTLIIKQVMWKALLYIPWISCMVLLYLFGVLYILWGSMLWCINKSVYIAVWSLIVLLFGQQDELTLSGYRKYLTAQAAPLPLTAAEEELRQIKLNEVRTRSLRSFLGSSFPFEISLE